MRFRHKFLVTALVTAISGPTFADIYTNEQGQRVECHEETVATREGHPVAAPLAGAVVGGLVGHNFGKGTGRSLATGVGAVGGAVVGQKYDQSQQAKSGEVRRVCQPVG